MLQPPLVPRTASTRLLSPLPSALSRDQRPDPCRDPSGSAPWPASGLLAGPSEPARPSSVLGPAGPRGRPRSAPRRPLPSSCSPAGAGRGARRTGRQPAARQRLTTNTASGIPRCSRRPFPAATPPQAPPSFSAAMLGKRTWNCPQNKGCRPGFEIGWFPDGQPPASPHPAFCRRCVQSALSLVTPFQAPRVRNLWVPIHWLPRVTDKHGTASEPQLIHLSPAGWWSRGGGKKLPGM